MNSDDKDSWMEACREELKSHQKNGTWNIRARKRNEKVVGSTWTFDIKRKEDGTIERYKARFCAQGFSQRPGMDFDKTYANSLRSDTLRILIAYAAKHGYRLTSADIKTAYLSGTSMLTSQSGKLKDSKKWEPTAKKWSTSWSNPSTD